MYFIIQKSLYSTITNHASYKLIGPFSTLEETGKYRNWLRSNDTGCNYTFLIVIPEPPIK